MSRHGVVAAVIAAALIAGACASDTAAPLVTTTTVADGGGRGAMFLFEPVFEQVDCPAAIARAGLACGTVELLLDADDVDAGTTDISIATLAGTEAGSGAMAVLQGGPGGASTDLAAWLPVQPFTQVFVDQRGTGFASNDLDCPEYDAVLPELLELPAAAVDEAGAAALDACARRLGDNVLLEHADSATHADDVATVMLGLGYIDGWYAYGVSYGSTIAMELLREARTGLAGVVLDGVYPAWLDLDTSVVESGRSSIEAIGAACAADPRCLDGPSDFPAALDALVEALDADPMVVDLDADHSGFGRPVEVRLDGRRLAELTFLMLYSEASAAGLPGAVAALADRDPEVALWLASNGSRTLAASYAANDEATYFAVQCAERAPIAGGIDQTADGFVAEVLTTPLSEACEPWEVEALSADALLDPIESDLPVLLLSGAFDPITPSAYAEAVAEHLPRGTVINQGGRGHGIWIGNDCIQAIVADFVAGEAAPDAGCAAEPVPVNWFTPG